MIDTAAALSITVTIITYRRPKDLDAALPVVLEQVKQAGVWAELLVIDNDPAGTAREYVESFAHLGVRYEVEAEPGIAAARNRALDVASDSDLIVFIDDDERPTPGWLGALLEVYLHDRPAAVVGPVVSSFERPPDPWLLAGGFFHRRQFVTGSEVTVAATNNLLLDMAQVRTMHLRFDVGLGLVGGSDNLFTRQLHRGGGRIIWCAEAVVTDVVPQQRMTRQWVLKRSFRTGNGTSLVSVRLATSWRSRLVARTRQVALGLTRLGFGIARIGSGILMGSLTLKASGARNCARGLGLITGAFGYAYAEYRR